MELLERRSTMRWVRRRTRRLSAGLVLAALVSAGCSQTLRPEQADRAEQLDVDALLHEHLQAEPMVTVAEAHRVLLLLADGEENYADFGARQAALEERGIARSAWGLRREACIDRGSVAYMMCRILEIRGGVNLALLGGLGVGDRRYAVRELVYRRMMEPGPHYGYLTGSELVDLVARADRYMAKRGMYDEEGVDISEVIESGGAANPP